MDGQTDEPIDSYLSSCVYATKITLSIRVSLFFLANLSFSALYAGPLSAVMVHLDQLFPDQPKRSLPQRLLWL